MLETAVFEHNANLHTIAAGSFGKTSATLQTLEISGSPALTTIEAGGFVGLGGLKKLSLLVCGVAALDNGVFEGLGQLTDLVLELGDLVYIGGNALSHLIMLRRIRIAHATQLAALPATIFNGLYHHWGSSLGGEGEGEGDVRGSAGVFAGGGEGETSIVLENLGLSSLSFLTPTNGAALHVERVEVSCMPAVLSIPTGAFDAISASCTNLNLNSNGVTAIAPQAFVKLTKLVTLELQGNANLERLSGGVFDGVFDKTAEVHLNLNSNGLRFISPEAITFRSHKMSAPINTIITASSYPGTHLDVCCSYEWMALDPHWAVRGLRCANTLNTLTPLVTAAALLDTDNPIANGEAVAEETFATTVQDITELDDSAFGCCFERGWQSKVDAINDVGLLIIGNVGAKREPGLFSELPTEIQRHLDGFCANASWSSTVPTAGGEPDSIGIDIDSSSFSLDLPTDCNSNSNYTSFHGCPDLKFDFQKTWDPAASQCVLDGCPSGYREDIIGRRRLVDCEPWLHAERPYDTVFAAAERQCVECAVTNCAVCDGGEFRVCSKCSPGFSLFTGVSDDDAYVEHICTATCSEYEHYSAVVSAANAESGGIGGATTTGGSHVCIAWTTCGEGEHEEVAPTEDSDRSCKVNQQLDVVVVGSVIGASVAILLISAAVVKYRAYRRTMRAFDFTSELDRLKSELEAELARKGLSDSGFGSGSGSDASPGFGGGGTGGVGGASGGNRAVESSQLKIPREIKRSSVTTTGALGHGAFGDVFKAVLLERGRAGGSASIVALKTAHVTRKGKAETDTEASSLMYVRLSFPFRTRHPHI